MVVSDPSSHATVVASHSSCAVLKLILHSKQESRVTESAESCWDAGNIHAPLSVTLDFVHPVQKPRNKNAIVEDMNDKHDVVMEYQKPLLSMAKSKRAIMNAMRRVKGI